MLLKKQKNANMIPKKTTSSFLIHFHVDWQPALFKKTWCKSNHNFLSSIKSNLFFL